MIALIPPADRWDGDDGRAALMVGHDVVVLSPLAVALIDLLADGPRSEEWIAERLVQTAGSPPDDAAATQWVRDTCAALRGRGVVANVSDE